MSQLKEKFDWVKGEMDSWKLNREERSWLLGGDGIECAINLIEPDSKAGKLLEARFDAIHHVKEMLDLVYGGNVEQETVWLRTPTNPLEGKSPLEFIRDGNQHAVQEVASSMDGP